MKAILWVVVVVVIVGAGWMLYNRNTSGKGFGDVPRDRPLYNRHLLPATTSSAKHC